MTVKGIIFDKDGTLIRFESVWIDATYQVIDSLADTFGHADDDHLKEKLAKSIGLNGNDVSEHGFLASGTTKDFAAAFADILHVPESSVLKEVNQAYDEEIEHKLERIEAIGDLPKLFESLKQAGYRLGVITADNYYSTNATLKKLGIYEYIDFIGTADLYNKKPERQAMDAFCQKMNLSPNEVIHVGDTDVDLAFSKHCLHGIGVLSGVGTFPTLSTYTDYIIKDVHELWTETNTLICEN
ncbi:HAD family hydrolase [Alkalicoccobacillus plakortidis]|uniref:HAD family hydrolase n=1 Tax=Alkalicoccobacillus plakortidis TaxID=444060 RepID=A0ABT0XKS7_9BACI|nr:HAD family hydrolase [Alkalicoccobacillus plakortidis]MCM2676335.1 HAD family hydrolase [Alkalicoccobacillus plakortidis]